MHASNTDLATFSSKRGRAISESMRTKRERGEAFGPVPFGYRRELRDGTLVDVPKDSDRLTIITAQRLHEAGHSVREIRRLLFDAGMAEKSGKPLSVGTIHGFIAKSSGPSR